MPSGWGWVRVWRNVPGRQRAKWARTQFNSRHRVGPQLEFNRNFTRIAAKWRLISCLLSRAFAARSQRQVCGIDNEARGREFLQMHENSSHVSNVARSDAFALSLCNFKEVETSFSNAAPLISLIEQICVTRSRLDPLLQQSLWFSEQLGRWWMNFITVRCTLSDDGRTHCSWELGFECQSKQSAISSKDSISAREQKTSFSLAFASFCAVFMTQQQFRASQEYGDTLQEAWDSWKISCKRLQFIKEWRVAGKNGPCVLVQVLIYGSNARDEVLRVNWGWHKTHVECCVWSDDTWQARRLPQRPIREFFPHF